MPRKEKRWAPHLEKINLFHKLREKFLESIKNSILNSSLRALGKNQSFPSEGVGVILFNKGKFMRIKDIPKVKRPREKLIYKAIKRCQ